MTSKSVTSHPDMRPNDWKSEPREACACGAPIREVAENLALLARIERAACVAGAGKSGTKLTFTQRDALMPYANGYTYRTIAGFLGIQDITAIGRIAAGLTTLDRIDELATTEVGREADSDDTPSSPFDSTQAEMLIALAFSIAGFIQARGRVEATELWGAPEFEDRLEAAAEKCDEGWFDRIVVELKEHGIQVELSAEGWHEAFTFDLDAA